MVELKEIDWRIIVTAISCITILEAIALFQGIDGILLTCVIAGLMGVAGRRNG